LTQNIVNASRKVEVKLVISIPHGLQHSDVFAYLFHRKTKRIPHGLNLQQQPQKNKLTRNIITASSGIQEKQVTGIPRRLNLER